MTTPNPDGTLVERLTALHQAHPWLDPTVATALAASATPTAALQPVASSLQQGVTNTWNGLTQTHADPVLLKSPTSTSAFIRFLSGTVGPMPVADSDLIHIQSELAKRGFGKGLSADGVWSQAWNGAYLDYSHQATASALAGNKPGSVSVHSIMHGILHAITPSGMADNIMGFIKSIPADIGQFASDVWGGATSAWYDVSHPSVLIPGMGNPEERKQQAKTQTLAAENNLGVNTYRQAIGLPVQDPEHYNSVVNGLNDIGTVFLFTGGGSGVKAIRGIGRQEIDRGLFTRLATKEAIRGPGVITRTLLTAPAKRALGGATLGAAGGAVQGLATGSDLTHSIEEGALLGAGAGLAAPLGKAALKKTTSVELPTLAARNLPVIGRAGPIVGRLLPELDATGRIVEGGAPGLYYALRTKLATPYQFGATRLLAGAASQAQAWSLKAQAIGYLESKFGADAGTIQTAMETSHPLDTVNHALRAATGQITGGAFHADLDSLTYLMGRGTAAQALTKDVNGVHDRFVEGMVDNGLLRQFENGSGKTYAQHLSDFGGDTALLHTFLQQKVYETATWHAAEEAVARAGHNAPDLMAQYGVTQGEWAWSELVRAEAAAIWHNPEALDQAVKRLAAPNHQYLTDAIRQQMTDNLGTGEAFKAESGVKYVRAGNAVRELLDLPDIGKHLLTPQKLGWQATTSKNLAIKDKLNPTYLGAGDIKQGVLGLMRKDGLTRQAGTVKLKQLKAQMDTEIARDGHVSRDWYDQILGDLHNQFNLPNNRLLVFDGDPEKLINLYSDRVEHLAAEVFPHADAPQHVLDRIDRIKAEGYRLVAGEDIGHGFRPDLPTLTDFGHATTRLRRSLERVGLGTDLISRRSMATDRRYRITSNIAKDVFESGKYPLPAYSTPQTIVRMLSDPDMLPKSLGPVRNALMDLFARAHKATTDALIETGKATNQDEALTILKQELAANGGLARLSLKDFKTVLQQPVRINDQGLIEKAADGAADAFPYLNDEATKAVYRAVTRAYADTPVQMLGASKIENLIRYAPFKLAQGIGKGESDVALHIANLPSNLFRLRDQLRFNLSPLFDARRVVKTNVKMGLDGIQPTLTPVKHLRESGQWDEAHALLDRINGTQRFTHMDDADAWLDAHGVFGIYNPRHYEAYYALMKKQQGATDDDIKTGLVRVFQYGRQGAEGRTAAERTMNTVFFPFSFEKTVMRNLAGYMLDRPAQMLILSNSLDAYREFSNHHKDNPLAQAWIENHMPLLQEAERLNTFAHGFSLGEFGGVNAPTVKAIANAFLPQQWQMDAGSTSLLSRYIPAVTDLQRIINEGTEQSKIVRTSLNNGWRTLQGDDGRGLLNSQPVAETSNAQIHDALELRGQLITAFKDVLAYNSGKPAEAQYTFGSGPGIPEKYRNAPITKSNISEILHLRYPAFDPTMGANIAEANKRNFSIMLRELKAKNDPRFASYSDFYEKANSAIGHLNRDQYDPQQEAQVMQIFRDRAIEFARHDPKFLGLYNKMFRSSFGPIEAIQ